jgi:hypothetical protein
MDATYATKVTPGIDRKRGERQNPEFGAVYQIWNLRSGC